MKKFLALLGTLCMVISTGFAQTDVSKPILHTPTYFDVSPPLRDMVKQFPGKVDNSWKDGIVKNQNYPFGLPTEEQMKSAPVDPNVQRWFGRGIQDTTIQNFDGNSNSESVIPPDTYGEVGPNDYFQVVNMHYAIYSKTGSILLGPVANSSVWSGMSNNHNDGDATISYDETADRWVFTQFSLPNFPNGSFYQMIAVSQTNDPTGSWYRYQYTFSSMGDYPKMGVWPDGYYQTINRFSAGSTTYQGVGVMAYNRSKMLTGDPTAEMVEFTLSAGNEAYAMLPSDCDGTFPPSGTPAYISYHSNNHIRIYEFHVDWTNTANSTFTQTVTLPVNSFNGSLSGIPQKGTSKTLDPLPGRIMYRMPFRKFNDHWSMVANSTINVGSGVAGIRWYELRNTGTGWSIYQQGTWSPDGNCRWMGSIAMDSLGNIALGYSISSSSLYPSIRYTGRLAGDALGTMTIGEHGIKDGGGYQTYSGSSPLRWGDYSGMSVDPSAPSTFWYTQQYNTANNMYWHTRIASFSLGNIFMVNATATPSTICLSQSSQLNAAASGGSGTYTYSWTSLPAGFTSTIQNPLVTPDITTKYIAAVNDGTETKRDTVQVTVNGEPTANAGPNATYPNTTPLFAVAGTATFYSSVKWTTDGDGFFNIDTVLNSVYHTGTNDKNYGGVLLTLQANPISPCTDISTDTVFIRLNFPVGIPSTSSVGFGISILPNPSNGIFNLVVRGVKDMDTRVQITDLTGKTIFQDQERPVSLEYTKTVDVSGFPKGIYMVKVQTDMQSVTKKLVIQ